MKLYSTNDNDNKVSYEEAIMQGLAIDKGLFMPINIPTLSENFIKNLDKLSFQDISFNVAQALLGKEIPKEVLKKIINNAINFDAPIKKLDDTYNILELFHGPTLAFKDFGARFMSGTMGYFNRNNDKELIILVATSGDTGGAVASGFHKTPGIKVVILYPSGKVSPLQEKQLTTLGENIFAIEVKGTFDDCQAMVKSAFIDKDLNKLRLSSANSINIARLIPQSFYYFESFKQLENNNKKKIYTVPSGNFGNITAGIIAQKMGLPIDHFIAATNINNIVPQYLKTGEYKPKPSIKTISNAMDVGNPSNFIRMKKLYSSTWNIIRNNISGFSYTDLQTKEAVKEVYIKYNYIIDPHGAIGYLASKEHSSKNKNTEYIILETAHSSKFLTDIEAIIQTNIYIPKRLKKLKDQKKIATIITNNYVELKEYLLNNFK